MADQDVREKLIIFGVGNLLTGITLMLIVIATNRGNQ